MNKNNNDDFVKSALKTYDNMIEHYEIVIKDLSGEVYNLELQSQKGPVVEFLKNMQEQWKKCREDFVKNNMF